MQCPHLSKFQSIKKGQKRLDQAIDFLGPDVANKILGFSLYVLGYPYDFISDTVRLSEPGLKTLIQDVYENGVEPFLDKRKKVHPVIKNPQETANPPVKYIEHDEKDIIEFKLTCPISLRIRKDDSIGKKLLTLLFIDANLLKQAEAAKILKCKRLAVYQNLKKIRSIGTKGLIDNRKGQKTEYKFDAKVKGEIVKGYLLSIFENKIPTKTNITQHLREKFSEKYSEEAVALHLKKLGFPDNKNELYSEIAQQINERINSLEYIKFAGIPLEAKYERNLKPLKQLKEELTKCYEADNDIEENFFQLEKRVESFQSKLQSLLLESLIKAMKDRPIKCPTCHSSNTTKYKSNKQRGEAKVLKTSLGGSLILTEELLFSGRCNNCGKEFDLGKNVLKLPEQAGYSPLTGKKICSANRAGSYENAVKNLKELINLDINRNQVRKISKQVGEYIIKDFKQLYKDISEGLPAEIIHQRYPLIEELKINKKYLDTSKYLITLAVDGGRMQLFNWVPPSNENSKAKKSLYWHENKVFRISIYDKTKLEEISDSFASTNVKKVYKSARIISGLTTYGATNVTWKETIPLIKSHLYVRGIQPENVHVCISDGSEHIMREIFVPIFPKATHILDYYHKTEALYACIKSIGMSGSKIEEKLKDYLWEGKISDLIGELKEIQLKVGKPHQGKRNSEDPKVKLDNLINHLSKNKERLSYKYYREQGYPIGSGSVESAVKLFGKRIKGTEKQWNEDGGEAILNLYAFLLSEDDRWNNLWEVKTPWI